MQPNPEPTPRQPVPATAAPERQENAAAFPPLPLRPRGILELVDVAIKVYRQYFAVLLGWSVLIAAGSILAGGLSQVVRFSGLLLSLLLTPLITGVVACCLAAGVRGQRVDFSQCWHFTRPRFWPMVGLYILALLMLFVALIVFSLGCALIGGLVFLFFRNAAPSAQLVLALIGSIILLTVVTIFATVVAAWTNLVPIVVCMEPDKMNSRALSRAYELMRGQWGRVCALTLMLGLGMLALYAILGLAAVLFIGLPRLRGVFSGHPLDIGIWPKIVGVVLLNGVLYIIYKPIFTLILGLLYLDIRVRNEALDLEWNAHVTAPQWGTPSTTPSATPVQLPTGFAAANPSPPVASYTDSFATPPTGNATPLAHDVAPSPVVASPENDFSSAPVTPPASFEAAPSTTPTGETEVPAPQGDLAATASDGQTITCPQCGATSPASSIFCLKCGTNLRAAESGPRW